MLTSSADFPSPNKKLLSALLQLSPETRAHLQTELKRRIREGQLGRRLYSFYPDTGPLRRDLYAKHLEFFAAGTRHTERAILGGNRSGKSTAIFYETALHMIGWYPDWWVGHRFDRPITAWLCGEDTKAMRESLQINLFGPPGALGTGIIPRENIVAVTPRSGTPEAYDTCAIRHSSGGISRGVLKTYDQGRESYQGSKIELLVLDEEPPQPIYSEGLMRTMATVPGERNGLVISAFTPLKGLSEVVMSFLPALKAAADREGIAA
jgi:phage terminase large subunit-like protein